MSANPIKDMTANMSTLDDRRYGFLGWQCRLRQLAVRQREGRPSDGMVPLVTVDGSELGRAVVLILKRPEFGVTEELRHMVQSTNDPRVTREKGLRFLASSYYQRAREFQDVMTGLFNPDSSLAEAVIQAGQCRLVFEQYEQQHSVMCDVESLAPGNYSYDATFWHNSLFNPSMPATPVIVGFTPIW